MIIPSYLSIRANLVLIVFIGVCNSAYAGNCEDTVDFSGAEHEDLLYYGGIYLHCENQPETSPEILISLAVYVASVASDLDQLRTDKERAWIMTLRSASAGNEKALRALDELFQSGDSDIGIEASDSASVTLPP